MKPIDRQDWIAKYMKGRRRDERFDICDAEFVDAYIEATEAPFGATNYGANKCPQLGRDLSAMFNDGVLKRERMGIDGMAGMGFPRWVYLYRLAHPVKHPNGAPMYDETGMMLDDQGNRSIFDDIDD